MVYENFFQAFVVSFREGLEAFLIIAILLKFLDKTNNSTLKKSVWQGTYSGILASLVFGYFLMLISASLGGSDAASKLWESIASFAAVILITTFIIWMIHHFQKKGYSSLLLSWLYVREQKLLYSHLRGTILSFQS